MKKLVILLLLLDISLYASAKSELINSIIKLFTQKDNVLLYVDDEYRPKGDFGSFILTNNCQEADFYIVNKITPYFKSCLEKNSLVMATNYKEYMKYKNILGVIFWQKGRLNIIFRQKRLDELSVKLPKAYDKYIE